MLRSFSISFRVFSENGVLPSKACKHDAFQQVAERHVLQFGQTFQDLEQAFFHAYASLHAFHDNGVFGLFFHGTNVPMYQDNVKMSPADGTQLGCATLTVGLVRSLTTAQ